MIRPAAALRLLLAASLLAPAPALAQTKLAAPRLVPVSAAARPVVAGKAAAVGVAAMAFPTLAPAAAAVLSAAGAPAAVHSPLAPATALETLALMPAAADAKAGQSFDGSIERDGEDDPAAELAAGSKIYEKPLELWFRRKDQTGLAKDHLDTLIRPVFGYAANARKRSWSQKYWESFQKGRNVIVKTGMQTMFVSRVQEARTTTIRELTRADFEGFYAPRELKGKSLAQLRSRLVAELTERNATKNKGTAGIMSLDSAVRVVRVMKFKSALALPENNDGAGLAPIARREIALPSALKNLSNTLPKAVVVDMRLFTDAVPYALIEDISKLMKAGVYFIFLSDKPSVGPGSVDDLLTRGLTPKQRDNISRYKMITVTDDGNALGAYDGAFERYLPNVRFTRQEQELMVFAAQQLGLDAEVRGRGTELVVDVSGVSVVPAGKLSANMKALGLKPDQWSFSSGEENGRATLSVRPRDLVSALPHVWETLRDREDLYLLPSDVMTISRDPGVLKAMAGSVRASDHFDAAGEELVDASFAAMLGEYRENRPGDIAASASKLASLAHGSGGGYKGGESVYMMMGHVIHATFNWALWRYRQDGVLPAAEDLVELAKRKWRYETDDAQGNLLDRSGENLAGFHEIMISRLKIMHGFLQDVMKHFPIVIGTELPNLQIVERHKKGAFLHRDILRLIFDLALARRTPDGLEVVIADFKTGQTPTIQNLEKDTQVQLYDLLVRRMWPQVPLPYGGTGILQKVADYGIKFIYPSGFLTPTLTDWTRDKFYAELRAKMAKLRKLLSPKKPEERKAGGKKAAQPKGASVKLDKSLPAKADFDSLDLPRVVPGLKIKKQFAQQIIAGTKKIEYRTVTTNPKAAVAIIQTFTDEEPGRPAEVIGFARIEKATRNDSGQYEWHLSHVTPVKPYVVPNNKPGAIIWVKDVPVAGAKRLKK